LDLGVRNRSRDGIWAEKGKRSPGLAGAGVRARKQKAEAGWGRGWGGADNWRRGVLA